MSHIELNASQIEQAIRGLYSKRSYVVLSQVRNGTGFARLPRTADMLVFSVWPSRGLFAEGIEIKCSRSDFKSEMANPEKAEELARYCRYWYLAVPVGLLDIMPTPANWGVIEVDDKLKCKVTRQPGELTPAAWDNLFTCAVLRSFSEDYVSKQEIQPRINAGVREAAERIEKNKSHRVEELEKALVDFKEHSGIDLMERGYVRFDLKELGQAVRMILEFRRRPVEQLQEAKQAFAAASAAVDVGLGLFRGESA